MNKHYTNTNNPIDFPQSKDQIDEFINGYADQLDAMSDADWENLGKSFLIHKKGNLLDLAEAGEFDVIVQGCNCFNTMGGGIAREIRERYPVVASVDMETVKGDYNKLGTYTECDAGEKSRFTVINAYTQYNMSKGTDVFEYAAFELILQKICYKYGKLRIGLPYIGMGLAGGDKDVILEQIEYFAAKVNERGGTVTLVEFGG
jgi:O-acetyl-ADP-ribose deacetylase (regulator of RNase III)